MVRRPVTLAGSSWRACTPKCHRGAPVVLRGLVVPGPGPPPRPWDAGRRGRAAHAIAFAGLGGFWVLFYSYWLREKGAGMAAYAGRVTGPVTGKSEVIDESRGSRSPDTDEDVARMGGGSATPRGLDDRHRREPLHDAHDVPPRLRAAPPRRGSFPRSHEIAVVQARFFEASWGPAGRVVFLVVAACFLTRRLDGHPGCREPDPRGLPDRRVHRARRIGYRKVYYGAALAMTAITSVTIPGTRREPSSSSAR